MEEETSPDEITHAEQRAGAVAHFSVELGVLGGISDRQKCPGARMGSQRVDEVFIHEQLCPILQAVPFL